MTPSTTLRSRLLRLACRLAAPVILRLALGRFVPKQGRIWFAEGFADESVAMPPIMRGLLAMPGGRQMLHDVAHYAWHHHPVERLAMPDARGKIYDAANVAARHSAPDRAEGEHRKLNEAASYAWFAERGRLERGGIPDLGGNLFTAWTGPGLSFLHIEKCGGIAVMHWLAQKFHPEQINRDDHRDLPPHLAYRTPYLYGVDTARFPMIWGHYDVPTLRRFAPTHALFTVLREPRSRIVSLYHFWHSVAPDQFDPELSFSVALAHRLSLEEFLNHDDPMLRDLIDNLYVRRLTGNYTTGAVADPVHDTPDAVLAQALGVLDSLAFAGITEDLDTSMAMFAAQLNIAPPAQPVRANVTAENHADPSGWFRAAQNPTLTPAVDAALDRLTSLDQVIYQKVKAGIRQLKK